MHALCYCVMYMYVYACQEGRILESSTDLKEVTTAEQTHTRHGHSPCTGRPGGKDVGHYIHRIYSPRSWQLCKTGPEATALTPAPSGSIQPREMLGSHCLELMGGSSWPASPPCDELKPYRSLGAYTALAHFVHHLRPAAPRLQEAHAIGLCRQVSCPGIGTLLRQRMMEHTFRMASSPQWATGVWQFGANFLLQRN